MTATPQRPGRGRRPAAQVRAAVLAATSSILLEQGITGVTFERVAAAAGSSKMTLYKWWPTPGALAAEAYFATSELTLSFPDTGEIEADLRTQLHAFATFLTETDAGRAVAGLVGAAQSDPELGAAWSQQYSLPRRELAVRALKRARARGQIADGVDLESVVDQLWGACYHRLLVPDRPLDLAFADHLVDNVVRGIAPRHATTAVREGLTGIVSAARGRFGRR